MTSNAVTRSFQAWYEKAESTILRQLACKAYGKCCNHSVVSDEGFMLIFGRRYYSSTKTFIGSYDRPLFFNLEGHHFLLIENQHTHTHTNPFRAPKAHEVCRNLIQTMLPEKALFDQDTCHPPVCLHSHVRLFLPEHAHHAAVPSSRLLCTAPAKY